MSKQISSFLFANTSQGAATEQEEVHKIRITVSGTNVANLEKVCTGLKTKCAIGKIAAAGPIRLPTQVLRLTVRKSPCGEGTNTFDRFQMRIHKRIIDFEATSAQVKDITNMDIAPGVNVEIVIAE
jgi:small subunit ribosomal protein S20e